MFVISNATEFIRHIISTGHYTGFIMKYVKYACLFNVEVN